MGAVRRLATVVMVGLVALSTVLVIYLADEPNRQTHEQESQLEFAVERGTALYLQYCMSCHGPAGEGSMNVAERGTGRIGMAIGGNTDATILNQTAVNAEGTPFKGGMEGRYEYLHNVLINGRGLMPAWGKELNGEQIYQLVVFIQHVDWNLVYNEAIAASGGYPTPPPGKTPAASAATTSTSSGADYTVILHDIYFDPVELTIPSNTEVTILARNEGAAPHNFAIDALGISVDVAAGAEELITIPATKAGEYEYYCNVAGHKEAGMVGKLIVSDSAKLPETAAPAAATEAPADGGSAASGQTVEVTVADIYFAPEAIEVTAGSVTFRLDASGAAAPHNFAIDALGVSVDVAPGEVKEVTVDVPAGEYEFYCNVPGHREAGMHGALTAK